MHVNHGLAPAAAEDEALLRRAVRVLGVALHVERVEVERRGTSRVAPARRYVAAERVRAAAGLDRIATGHTATDQVETVLYRLRSSPGRRRCSACSRAAAA